MSRLMSLCELYISKHVERATKHSIAKADVDVIGEVIHSLSYQPKQLTLMAVHIHVHIYVHID